MVLGWTVNANCSMALSTAEVVSAFSPGRRANQHDMGGGGVM